MKTKTILLSLALSLCLASTVAITVSCEKSGLEDEPMVGATKPGIIPTPTLYGNEFDIKSDGTTISGTSNGYSFRIAAGELTLSNFKCYLSGGKQYFDIISSCNLTLVGGSSITAYNGASIRISDVKLSGRGTITIIRNNKDFSILKSHISAAEGYTVKVSDVKDEGGGYYSCKWTVV
jgi:hypothetical protein